MGLKFLQDIVNLDNIQFVNGSGTNAGLINMDGDDLVISNAIGGVFLGTGADDIYIGDGTSSVDIRFEQNMSIYADSSTTRTLTLGGPNTNLVLDSPSFSGTVTLGATSINNKLNFTTSNGYINFDYEPSGETGEYSTPTKLLTVSNGSNEEVIMQRLSQSGALMIGHDDIVAIAAGDTWSILRDNIGWTGENVILSSEAGFTSYAFPNNDTAWSNRNTFRFYGGDATAGNNGLYIGDGGSTQFIDLDRNLKNIGTITATGDFNLTNGFYLAHNDGIRIGETGDASTSWTTLTSFTNGGNSAMKIKGGNYIHHTQFETTWNDFLYARIVSSYNGTDSSFSLYKSDGSGNTAATTTISTGASSFAGSVTAGGNIATSSNSYIVSSRKFTARDANGTGLFADDAASGLSIADDGDATFTGSVTATTLFGNHADGNGSSLKLGRADNSNYWLFNHAGNDLRIYNEASSGSDILLGVDASGNAEANNVGIGTATPGEKLEVAGNIAVSGTVDGVDIATRDAVLTSTTTTANAALPKAGGTMTGQLAVNHNGGTLNLVGTDHTYIQWYPAGISGGRHAYTGFGGGGTDHFTIANETSGAHINLTTNSGTVNVTGNLSVTGTVDGVDIGANYANWNTAYGWGDHSSAGYLTAHPNISAASSVNNSGKTYIQDITLDSNGHVTGIVSHALTSSDFVEPNSNATLNSLSCGSFTHPTDIAFVLDNDNNETASFIIKDGGGNSAFTLTEDGDLTITGKFVSTYAAKGSSGDILVDDSGEIKKRTPTELKTDLSLNNVPNTDATNASNLASGTVPTARLATTAIAKGGTGATTASGARAALGVDAAGTDNSTDVTLAGSLNYITISGQEITRNAIDLAADVTGTLPQTNLPDDMDSDKVKQICVTNHGFALDSNTSAPNYFPLNNLNETRAGDTAQYYARMIAPYAGRVVKVMVRADANIGNSCSVVLTKLSTSGQSPDGLRDEGTDVETVSSVDCSAINTTHTFTFSSGTFGSGDVVNIGLQKNSSNTANVTAVVVWEYTL